MKIKSIQKINKGMLMMDIEVENTNSYQLSNGIISHNSLKGILQTNKSKKEEKQKLHTIEKFENGVIKRPKDVLCDIHISTYKGEKFFTIVGIIEEKPYEVFFAKKNGLDINIKKGVVRKIKRGVYSLLDEKGEKTIIPNINESFDDTYLTLGRFISMSLRHGVDIKFIVEQLQKNNNFLAFEKVVSRILKKYIKDGEKTGEKCPVCGGDLVYLEGCKTCMSCGWSKCS